MQTLEKIITEIKSTKKYSLFSLINGNRIVSEKKILRIVESIKNGLDLTPYCPIIVSKTNQIIDGQHRLEACKTLNIPVYYIVADNISIRQIAELNSNTDKWKMTDFIQCYMNLGIDHYFTLNEFQENHKLGYTVSAQLLSGENVGDGGSHSASDSIQNGEFKVTNLNSTNRFMELFKDVQPYLDKPKNRILIGAFQKLYENNNFEQSLLIKKLINSNRIINQETTVNKTIYRIEEIYNYRRQKRVYLT